MHLGIRNSAFHPKEKDGRSDCAFVCAKCLFASPEDFDGVPPENFIGRKQDHSFDTSLRDQHPIKSIVVNMRQRASCKRVFVGDW